MKTAKIILSMSFVFLSSIFIAQIGNPLHETVASLKVSYKIVPQATITNTANSTPTINGVPQATINLKTETNISKVYFKILNSTTKAIIYQIDYNTNSSAITNNEGKKLFEKNNNAILISNGQSLPIKPYLYQIQTEDNQNKLSTIYSVIQ